MDVTKPHEFKKRLGLMDVTKPHEFIRSGAMDVTKPYESYGLGQWLSPRHINLHSLVTSAAPNPVKS